jgi:hypothetical protein
LGDETGRIMVTDTASTPLEVKKGKAGLKSLPARKALPHGE